MTSKRLELVPYDPAWRARFEAEAARLRAAIGAHTLGVEHIGSTSVVGMLAKPVIDVAVAVASEADADACVTPLTALGYEYRGTHGDDPSRRYYVLDREGRREVQLHLWILPTPAWARHLGFRDLLRARPDVAEAYAREKRRVADAVAWDKTAYADAKGPFVQRVLREHGLLHAPAGDP
jgi:GrpB-like predicted nucleotidyltransferase (UPF0157 family)